MFQFSIQYLYSTTIDRCESLIVNKYSTLGTLWQEITKLVDEFKQKNPRCLPTLIDVDSKLLKYNDLFIREAREELEREGLFDSNNEVLVSFGYYPCRLLREFVKIEGLIDGRDLII